MQTLQQAFLEHSLDLATGCAACLACGSVILERSAVKLARKAGPKGGEAAVPNGDITPRLRLMSNVLLLTAAVIVAAAGLLTMRLP